MSISSLIIHKKRTNGNDIIDDPLYAIILRNMLEKIEGILHKQCKIQKTELLLVGFSGGPDVLCCCIFYTEQDFVAALHVTQAGLKPMKRCRSNKTCDGLDFMRLCRSSNLSSGLFNSIESCTIVEI
jgi:hypothetical protein